MIKLVLFDVDGVLVRIDFFTNELQRKYGVSLEKTTKFFKGPFINCIIGKADLKEVISPVLVEWGWDKPVDDYLKEWFAYESSVNSELLEYIEQLKVRGVRCAVATNQEKYRARYLAENLGFNEIFESMYVSSELGFQKPELEFFENLYDRLDGVNKNEILFWDDSDSNVKSAREVGFNAEQYSDLTSFKQIMERQYA